MKDKKARAALRKSCATLYKSTSVNAQIQTFSWRTNRRIHCGDMDAIKSKLMNFPRHANLKKLELVMDCAEFGGLAWLLMHARTDKYDAVKARLSNVEELIFSGLDLDENGCDADCEVFFVPALFPRLKTLSMNRGTFPRSIFRVLAPMVHLRHLTVVIDSPQEKLMESIGKISSLQRLDLCASFYGAQNELDVAGLSGLQQLKELRLDGSLHMGLKPKNLHVVLSAIPLEHLRLRAVEMPVGVQYASNTLQTMHVNCLYPSFPALAAQNFPSLRAFYYGGLDFSDVKGGFSDELVLQTKQLVDWKVRCPSKASASQDESGYIFDGESAFRIKGKFNCQWSACQCTSLLVQMLPLNFTMPAIRRLTIYGWHFEDEGLLALGALLGSVEPPQLPTRAWASVGQLWCLNCKFTNDEGLVGILQALPLLHSLQLFRLEQIPTDIIAALFIAQHTSRPFHLVVKYKRNLILDMVSKQWTHLLANMPGPHHAKLTVIDEAS